MIRKTKVSDDWRRIIIRHIEFVRIACCLLFYFLDIVATFFFLFALYILIYILHKPTFCEPTQVAYEMVAAILWYNNLHIYDVKNRIGHLASRISNGFYNRFRSFYKIKRIVSIRWNIRQLSRSCQSSDRNLQRFPTLTAHERARVCSFHSKLELSESSNSQAKNSMFPSNEFYLNGHLNVSGNLMKL